MNALRTFHTAAGWLVVAAVANMTGIAALAQDMPLTQVLIEGEGWRQVAEGFVFSEGPAVDSAGGVYFSDVRGNQVYHVDAEGKLQNYLADSGQANGLMFGPDGRLYACQRAKRQVLAIDSSGRQQVLAADVEPNDIVVLGNGNVYFTEPAARRVWLVPSGGKPRVVDEGIERPNGVIAWPDQQTLVVADTRSKWCYGFRIEADGSLSARERYYELRCPEGSTESGADGLTVDRDGRLYVATRVGLQIFDPTGRLCGVLVKPQPGPLTNAVFAGPRLDVLYVTAGDKLYSRKTQVRGLRYFGEE